MIAVLFEGGDVDTYYSLQFGAHVVVADSFLNYICHSCVVNILIIILLRRLEGSNNS